MIFFSNPTPHHRLLSDKWILNGKIWQSVYNSDNISYFDIGFNLETKANPRGKDFRFWENLYITYGHGPFDTY